MSLCVRAALPGGGGELVASYPQFHLDTIRRFVLAACFSRSRRVIWAEVLRARIGIMKNVCCFCFLYMFWLSGSAEEYMHFS